MEKTTFLILLVTYFILFGLKRTILTSFHNKNEFKWITQQMASYLFAFLFVVLMVVGVLFTKTDDYSNVSQGFEKIRNPPNIKKPHKYFDIDFSRIFPESN